MRLRSARGATRARLRVGRISCIRICARAVSVRAFRCAGVVCRSCGLPSLPGLLSAACGAPFVAAIGVVRLWAHGRSSSYVSECPLLLWDSHLVVARKRGEPSLRIGGMPSKCAPAFVVVQADYTQFP